MLCSGEHAGRQEVVGVFVAFFIALHMSFYLVFHGIAGRTVVVSNYPVIFIAVCGTIAVWPLPIVLVEKNHYLVVGLYFGVFGLLRLLMI
jgi:hypothetical protein